MVIHFVRRLAEIFTVIFPGYRLLSQQLVMRSCCDGIGLQRNQGLTQCTEDERMLLPH